MQARPALLSTGLFLDFDLFQKKIKKKSKKKKRKKYYRRLLLPDVFFR
jgi:hypothetical protein